MDDVEQTPEAEPRTRRLKRRGQRAALYGWTVLLVAMVVVIVALIVANTKSVRVSWVVGHSRTSLIWIIVVSWIAGWIAGIATSILLRRRTRRL